MHTNLDARVHAVRGRVWIVSLHAALRVPTTSNEEYRHHDATSNDLRHTCDEQVATLDGALEVESTKSVLTTCRCCPRKRRC